MAGLGRLLFFAKCWAIRMDISTRLRDSKKTIRIRSRRTVEAAREHLPGQPGESFPLMFLSTSGLDSIDNTLVHTNKPLSRLQIRLGTLARCMHHRGSTHALYMPDLTASPASTCIGISAWEIPLYFLIMNPWSFNCFPSGPCRRFLPRRIEPRAAHVAADATLHIY